MHSSDWGRSTAPTTYALLRVRSTRNGDRLWLIGRELDLVWLDRFEVRSFERFLRWAWQYAFIRLCDRVVWIE